MNKENFQTETKQADMCINPWMESFFHGVLSWDAVYHNTIANISLAIETIRMGLVEGGMFIATLMSTKSLTGNDGKEIEKNTFLQVKAVDSGVLHHYFDRDEIEQIFSSWKPLVLTLIGILIIFTYEFKIALAFGCYNYFNEFCRKISTIF